MRLTQYARENCTRCNKESKREDGDAASDRALPLDGLEPRREVVDERDGDDAMGGRCEVRCEAGPVRQNLEGDDRVVRPLLFVVEEKGEQGTSPDDGDQCRGVGPLVLSTAPGQSQD